MLEGEREKEEGKKEGSRKQKFAGRRGANKEEAKGGV